MKGESRQSDRREAASPPSPAGLRQVHQIKLLDLNPNKLLSGSQQGESVRHTTSLQCQGHQAWSCVTCLSFPGLISFLRLSLYQGLQKQRLQGKSTAPRGFRDHRAKCTLNTANAAHAPWASPEHLAFSCPNVNCFHVLGDSLIPTTGSTKVPSFPVPGRGTGQASAQSPSARAPEQPPGFQMDSLTRNQLALGLSHLFAALGGVAVWMLTQQPVSELSFKLQISLVANLVFNLS